MSPQPPPLKKRKKERKKERIIFLAFCWGHILDSFRQFHHFKYVDYYFLLPAQELKCF
jgi:hypothetical protein